MLILELYLASLYCWIYSQGAWIRMCASQPTCPRYSLLQLYYTKLHVVGRYYGWCPFTIQNFQVSHICFLYWLTISKQSSYGMFLVYFTLRQFQNGICGVLLLSLDQESDLSMCGLKNSLKKLWKTQKSIWAVCFGGKRWSSCESRSIWILLVVLGVY